MLYFPQWDRAMENITISVNQTVLDAARRNAAAEHASVEYKLHEWLKDYAAQAETPEEAAGRRKRQAERAIATIDYLSEKYPVNGRKFTREEMNER